jgi:hypothetical protein
VRGGGTGRRGGRDGRVPRCAGNGAAQVASFAHLVQVIRHGLKKIQ